jgi:hypothetical protein
MPESCRNIIQGQTGKQKKWSHCLFEKRFATNQFACTPGTNVMILKDFLPQNNGEKMAIFARMTSVFEENVTIIFVFKKIAIFYRKSCKNIVTFAFKKISISCKKVFPKVVGLAAGEKEPTGGSDLTLR